MRHGIMRLEKKYLKAENPWKLIKTSHLKKYEYLMQYLYLNIENFRSYYLAKSFKIAAKFRIIGKLILNQFYVKENMPS